MVAEAHQTDSAHRSKRVVYVAIAANLAVAVCKYIAAAVTGSPAMLAEAFHSTADTGNECLLLVGMKRSARQADPMHPFGHGKVLYFYSLLVAVYTFGIGAALSIHQGVSHLRHPGEFVGLGWNYVVLISAAGFEFYSWRISYRELRSSKDPDESTWEEIIGSKDPTVFTVFLEDSASLIGIGIAFFGISLGHAFHNPYLDPVASILIGILLAAVAFFLGRESGALLVGERTSRARIRRVGEIIRADPAVEKMGDLLTMQLGPDQVLLTVRVKFQRALDVQHVESDIKRLEKQIHDQDPTIERIFIQPDPLDGRTNGGAAQSSERKESARRG